MATPTTTWPSHELDRIGNAEELRVSSVREDGTLTSPTTIWVVRAGDGLYVRPVNGRTGTWFRATQVRHEGHIQASGVSRDVSFSGAEPEVWEEVDAAYHAKYDSYGPAIVGGVLSPRSREATLRLMPR
jgi:hypothetical protein